MAINIIFCFNYYLQFLVNNNSYLCEVNIISSYSLLCYNIIPCCLSIQLNFDRSVRFAFVEIINNYSK